MALSPFPPPCHFTPTTAYTFTYGVFDLRDEVKVGTQRLAKHTYSNDRKYNLQRLDYGNSDSVQYEYDELDRIIKQTYEDGAYVTYTYDNDGELVKVYDSQSGITTAYTYDLSGRTVKVTESGTGHSLTVTYTYDAENNLSGQVETVNGTTHTYAYTYDEDNRVTKQTVDGVETSYTYDDFGRLTGKTVKSGTTTVTQDTYAFTTNGNATSGQVATVTQNGVAYTYTYDGNGNILSVSDGTNTASYVYDVLNQLVRENNQLGGYTHTWTYDNSGNIQARTEYAYTTGSLEGVTPVKTVEYDYDETNWGDLLIKYDGQALSYDDIGNLLSDGEWTYTWKHGRQLATASRNGITWNYTYNADGLRTKKDCGVLTFTYVYDGSQLAEMTFYTDLFKFTYGADGAPLTVDYNGTVYYYVTNLQGDVTEIRDASGQAVVAYSYDAWGKLLSTTGSMASTLGQRNPLRYRGYVYDQETCLYYLQSRYYDPEWGRFINGDAFASTGQGFVGNNMFAYCNNNPVNMYDADGRNPVAITVFVFVVIVIIAVVPTAVQCISTTIDDLSRSISNLISDISSTINLAKEKVEPEPPDVTYPGDDPKKAPDGYEWKGQGEQGSKEGNYHNPETGESLHPDLNHPKPIGPHWDYRDPSGTWWRIYPDNRLALK